jgi:hypothetical protein
MSNIGSSSMNIVWINLDPDTATSWKDITNNLGYPRPQGNLPNFAYGLTTDSQMKLVSNYIDSKLLQ